MIGFLYHQFVALLSRKVLASEYDIVYSWFEEKRSECERLLQSNEHMTNELRDFKITYDIILGENTRLHNDLKASAAEHLRLLRELEKAAEQIISLKNELHSREVMNETNEINQAHERAVYAVSSPLLVSNHTDKDVTVHLVDNTGTSAQLVTPFTQRAFTKVERTEIRIEDKPLVAGTPLGAAPGERVEIQTSVPGVKPRRKKKSVEG